MMDKSLSNRFAIMSLLCAILVVSIHIGRCEDVGTIGWYFSQVVSSGIAGVAIPFFFFTSGYFLAVHVGEEGWWRQALRKRVKTLLLPYFIWCLAFFLFDNAFCLLANVMAHAELTRNLYWNGVVDLLGLSIFSQPGLFVLWYVRALFLLVLISPLIVVSLRKIGWWVLLPLFVLYAYFIPGDEAVTPHGLLPFKWTFSLLGLFYFSLGMGMRMKRVQPILPCSFAAVSLLVGGGALAMQVYSRYHGITFAASPRPFMVLFLAIGVFSLIPPFRLPAWLMGCAFPIYILHCFCRLVPWTLLPNSANPLTRLVLTWLITVALCIVVATAMRKWLLKVTAILFGGR